MIDVQGIDLSTRKLCAICLQVASGLAYLHSSSLEHYDIKAENILVSRDITESTSLSRIHVKVTDFGLARLVPMDCTTTITSAMTKGAQRAGSVKNIGFLVCGHRALSSFFQTHTVAQVGRHPAHSRNLRIHATRNFEI